MNDTTQCATTSGAVEPDFYTFSESRDRDVRNRLIERHLGIAHHLARRYRYRGVAEEDLVQVATIGLLKAIERIVEGHRAVRSGARYRVRGLRDPDDPR